MGIRRVDGFAPREPMEPSPHTGGRWIFERFIRPQKAVVELNELDFTGGFRAGMDNVRKVVTEKLMLVYGEHNVDKVVIESRNNPLNSGISYRGEVYILTKQDLIDLEKGIVSSIKGEASDILSRIRP